MTQDTEDVVARLQRRERYFRNAIEGEYDANLMMKARFEIEALLADRQSLSDRIDVLTQALERIAHPEWGHCETCGTLCKGVTKCECRRPTWTPDDPAEVASAALHQEGIAP